MANQEEPVRQGELGHIIEHLNLQLSRLGLEWNDLSVLLKLREGTRSKRHFFSVSDDRIKDAAKSVFKERQLPDDRRAFKILLQELTELLNISLSLKSLESKLNRLASPLKNVWTITLFCFITYLVIGGIATGQSRLVGASEPITAFGILILLILVLGSLEGLQISITTLRMKDFSSLQPKYPRATALYSRFRDVKDTGRFLAGRQLLVIIVVFFAAQLTSFPDLKTWPFTSTLFPTWMAAWFEILLALGIPGALFVLWIGQLAPQFIANKHPLWFLNFTGMRLTLNLSFLVESLGLTKPGNWFSRLVHEGPNIPISAQEKYLQETDVVRGYGIIGLKKAWEVHNNECTLFCQNLMTFTKSEFHEIVDCNLVLKGTSVRPSFTYELLSGRETLASQEIYAERIDEERLSSGFRCFRQTLKPKLGSFRTGDVVCTKGRITCPSVNADQIIISRPTQYILFRIKFCDNPKQIKGITVTGYKMDEYIENPIPFIKDELPLSLDEEDTPFTEFIKMYPEVGTTYVFEWDVIY